MDVKMPQQSLKAFIVERLEAVREQAIRLLQVAGERCVNDARMNGSYTDRTRNLRGSTGYLIVEDGNILNAGGFVPVNGGGADGGDEGEAFAKRVAIKYPKGLVLILVAGMNYAAYVQDKGYNVLTSAEQLAEKLIPQLLKRLQ